MTNLSIISVSGFQYCYFGNPDVDFCFFLFSLVVHRISVLAYLWKMPGGLFLLKESLIFGFTDPLF